MRGHVVLFLLTYITLQAQAVPLAPDPVLDWNGVMLQMNANDHALQMKDQGGPVRTSRAFAIVNLAIYESVNSIVGAFTPYLSNHPPGYAAGASLPAAVGAAAFTTLSALYPQQRYALMDYYSRYLAGIPEGPQKVQGLLLGTQMANDILIVRQNDGSDQKAEYHPNPLPGVHVLDPLNPDQGFQDPHWGRVRPFAVPDIRVYRSEPPADLRSPRYAAAYREVYDLGGDGVTTPTKRTPDQTYIGLFWSYDGSPHIGVPPRLYNQIAQVIARQKAQDAVTNARLFALINVALADAGIQSWDSKYFHAFWRPIVAIRRTSGPPTWAPYGSPVSNKSGRHFTPNFPAYPSGHATFGAALFRTLERFYRTDHVPFTFVSDELNGRTRDAQGRVRPRLVRHFTSLRQAAEENGQSRIYLGIHWEFDKTAGILAGNQVADFVFDNFFRPIRVAGRPSGQPY